jgi:hypothetical protein
LLRANFEQNQGPRGAAIEDHELFLKRPLVSASTNSSGGNNNNSGYFEKEFHKIRIFELYEDSDGSGAFSSGEIISLPYLFIFYILKFA